jgi:dTDP-4-dehydrorhamnose 3,5-epimerase
VIFSATPIAGAFLIEPERHVDDRGSFARLWCARELEAHGFASTLAQCSVSVNSSRRTLRGMHYSVPPHSEAKVIHCIRGEIFDVLLDLRLDSPSYLAWFGRVLSADSGVALAAPEGVAHGFLTLVPDSHVLYHISEFHDAASARGVRWNDPAFAIQWPDEPVVISERDRTYLDYRKDA